MDKTDAPNISKVYLVSVSCYKGLLRLCMRNKILRSVNAKYHYYYLICIMNYEESDGSNNNSQKPRLNQ